MAMGSVRDEALMAPKAEFARDRLEGVTPEEAPSRLALRLLRAPLVNFSCHCSPSLRHSSVIVMQSGQHARNGTVVATSLELREGLVGSGSEGLRTGARLLGSPDADGDL